MKGEGGVSLLHPAGKICKSLAQKVEELLDGAGEVFFRDGEVLQHHIVLHSSTGKSITV